MRKPISRTVPFYHQVAGTIRDRITTGTYDVGSCVPSSIELEREFGVSNITIRKALSVPNAAHPVLAETTTRLKGV